MKYSLSDLLWDTLETIFWLTMIGLMTLMVKNLP